MNYDMILYYYARGLWPATLVRLAVQKGVITQEQCTEILSSKQ